MHLAWDYLHMVADNGNVALLELRERIYNTGSAQIPQDAPPPVLPYQQESVVAQAPQAGKACLACGLHEDNVRSFVLHEKKTNFYEYFIQSLFYIVHGCALHNN